MKAVIDGSVTVEHLDIETGSFQRQSIQRSAAGMDGVISIDMGGRARKIRHKIRVRESAAERLAEAVRALAGLHDGAVHTLETDDGQTYENLLITSVRFSRPRHGGTALETEGQIEYLQLRR